MLMALKKTMPTKDEIISSCELKRNDLTCEQFVLLSNSLCTLLDSDLLQASMDCTVRLQYFKLFLMFWHVSAVLRVGPLLRDAELRFAGPEVVKRKPEMGEHWSQRFKLQWPNGKQIGDFDLVSFQIFQARARERISLRRMSLEEFWAPFERVPQELPTGLGHANERFNARLQSNMIHTLSFIQSAEQSAANALIAHCIPFGWPRPRRINPLLANLPDVDWKNQTVEQTKHCNKLPSKLL